MRAETKPITRVRFALPSERLRPYVTTYYRTDINCSVDGAAVEDYLHPEWPNLRIIPEGMCDAAIGTQPMRESPIFSVSGPTSIAARFRLRSGRNWGIGLLPLGWAALIDANAGDYADRTVDGMADLAFAGFHPLVAALSQQERSFEDEHALIQAHIESLIGQPPKQSEAINIINAALVDPELTNVTQLAERVGISVRSVERLCKRVFGFPPKLLMRRQRFLRSLAQFMLDPSMKWLSTLDYRYHDQAHFVRDFRRFMGMNPTAYAKLDKPLLFAAAKARMEIAGEAVQGLHDPQPSE
ncbi:MAG: helix-turn-helix domain-containing protein [Erythrobacter sp.]